MELSTDISYLKGVGPARAQLLAREFQIFTLADLLGYFPYRYVDRSHLSTIDSLNAESQFVVLKGVLRDMETVQSGTRSQRLEVTLFDGTGTIRLVWFQGVKWMKESLKPNVEYLVMGKPSLFNCQWQMSHPEIEPFSENQPRRSFQPMYNSTEKAKSQGLTSKSIARLTETALTLLGGQIPENIPADVLHRFQLMPRNAALHAIHYPENSTQLSQATLRLKFEEVYFLQLDYQYARIDRKLHSRGRAFSVVGDNLNRFFHEKMPFEMTGAQKRVIHEIWADMKSGRQMNRLLQGDVGSGKTLVALLTMLLAIDNGFQACLMAPTEILASQHYENFVRMLDGMGLRVALLTGSLKAAQKRKVKAALAAGEVDILVGTHALIEPDVVFQKLGYVVIDEQHRFGVEQRSKLWAKSEVPPHVLVMTATPIPRTLAMTLYGDLECSVIDELPPGRQPIKTIHADDSKRLLLFDFMRQQIAAGRQVYVVYPLINESEKSDLKDLMDGYESIVRSFPLPDYQISIVHGQMPPEAKSYEMDRFKRGETHIMVSTTVIEVGVDVPNATVMVIENAERFGLSQLHQLRGRVGRGGGQSYCVLMTKSQLTKTGSERIATMCSSSDGFLIAEADLKLRGPGDVQGLRQSGLLELKLTDLVDDEPVVKAARDSVRQLLEEDPELLLPEHRVLKSYIEKKNDRPRWENIS